MSSLSMATSEVMGKRADARDTSDESARLRTFLDYARVHMETDQATLASELGMTKGAITHARRRGVSAEMRDKLDAWGLDRSYWDSPEWRTPANFIRKGPARPKIETEAALIKERITEIAKARGMSYEQIGKLVADVPKDRRTDPWWYFERLLALEDEAPASRARRPA